MERDKLPMVVILLRPHYTFYFSIIFIRIELKSSLEFYYVYDLNLS